MTTIRLSIDVGVNSKDHAQEIYDSIKNHIDWFGPFSPYEDYYIAFHICNHDNPNVEACQKYTEWRNGKVTWHNGEEVE